MGAFVKYHCAKCQWQSESFVTGVGLASGPDTIHRARKTVQSAATPELSNAKQALLDHPGAEVNGAPSVFQCPNCLALINENDYSVFQTEFDRNMKTSPRWRTTWFYRYHPLCPKCHTPMHKAFEKDFKCPQCREGVLEQVIAGLWD